jgi:flavin reductase (DIM6/NTAB) family NADH-FMN oxidoreductase RutF
MAQAQRASAIGSSDSAGRLDPAYFRGTVGHYPSGVTIVTAKHGEQRVGFACPVVSFAVAGTTDDHAVGRPGVDHVAENPGDQHTFCVNVLSERQGPLTRALAAIGANRFENVVVDAQSGRSAGAAGRLGRGSTAGWRPSTTVVIT